VCAFLSSKSYLVSVRVAYSVPEVNELAVQTCNPAVRFYLDRILPVSAATPCTGWIRSKKFLVECWSVGVGACGLAGVNLESQKTMSKGSQEKEMLGKVSHNVILSRPSSPRAS